MATPQWLRQYFKPTVRADNLGVNSGFDSLVFTAGATSQNQFISGAYDNADGQFASAPYTTSSGLHGSDYLIDVLLIGVKPEEINNSTLGF